MKQKFITREREREKQKNKRCIQILPFDEIANSLFNKAAAPPNKSTLNKPLSDTNFLHDMDKITLDIQTVIFFKLN